MLYIPAHSQGVQITNNTQILIAILIFFGIGIFIKVLMSG